MVVSLASLTVSTQYTNVTLSQTSQQQEPRGPTTYEVGLLYNLKPKKNENGAKIIMVKKSP